MSRVLVFAEVPDFYASVEIAQDPALAGRPVIVGGDPRKRGLVQAASADARAAGVETDMPMLEALNLCPRARSLRTDMALYRDVSRRLLACLRRELPRLESFGLAAAYFDATGSARPPEALGEALRARVAEELGLPLRVGIASGRFLARLAAEESGAVGLLRIAPGAERRFLAPLPVHRLEGVGRKTAAALAELGARCIGDVARLGRETLEASFGAHGLRFHALACAEDVASVRASSHPQSLSRETTLPGGTTDRGLLAEQLQDLARSLAEELERLGLVAGRVALRLRYADQVTESRSQRLTGPGPLGGDLLAVARALLERSQAGARAVRGVGLQLSRLAPAAEADRQLDLFPPGS